MQSGLKALRDSGLVTTIKHPRTSQERVQGTPDHVGHQGVICTQQRGTTLKAPGRDPTYGGRGMGDGSWTYQLLQCADWWVSILEGNVLTAPHGAGKRMPGIQKVLRGLQTLPPVAKEK